MTASASGSDMTGDQMAEIVDCPALRVRHIAKGYPFGDKVPKTVRLTKFTMTDFLPGIGFISAEPLVAHRGSILPAWTNSYGAVAAVYPNGKTLGLKPDEFEVVEWYSGDEMTTAADRSGTIRLR